MRLRVKEALLTETTSRYLLDELKHVGYSEEDAKVAVYHGNIQSDEPNVMEVDELDSRKAMQPNKYAMINGMRHYLKPDENGNIFTVGE